MISPDRRIAIGAEIHPADWLVSAPAGQSLLRAHRHSGHRPRCMCVPHGVEMYIGRRGTNYYLARMPGTGFLHAEDCESVEDNTFYSGAAAYMPGVIVEAADGALSMVADLDRLQRPTDPITAASMDGLLDLLTEHAALNRLPAHARSRSWPAIRDRLLSASQWIRIGGEPLGARLFVPMRYELETSAASLIACEAFLKEHSDQGHALICAPLKDVIPTPYGWRVILKHLPNLRLWTSRDIASTLQTRWGSPHFDTPPRWALCLVSAKPGRLPGNYSITNMACLPTDAHYMPCGEPRTATVLDALVAEGLSLLRPLRFDCDPQQPLADFVILRDDTPEPVFVLAKENDVACAEKSALVSILRRNQAQVRVAVA